MWRCCELLSLVSLPFAACAGGQTAALVPIVLVILSLAFSFNIQLKFLHHYVLVHVEESVFV